MLLTLGNATVEVQVVGRADFGRRKCVACGAAVVGVMLCDKCDEQPCGFRLWGMMPPCVLPSGHDGDHSDGFGGHYAAAEPCETCGAPCEYAYIITIKADGASARLCVDCEERCKRDAELRRMSDEVDAGIFDGKVLVVGVNAYTGLHG